jgi:hypothetical protein
MEGIERSLAMCFVLGNVFGGGFCGGDDHESRFDYKGDRVNFYEEGERALMEFEMGCNVQ